MLSKKKELGCHEDEDDLSRESGVSEFEHEQKGVLIGQWVNISFHEKSVYWHLSLFPFHHLLFPFLFTFPPFFSLDRIMAELIEAQQVSGVVLLIELIMTHMSLI